MKLREALTSTISHGDLKHNMLGSINEETGADRMGALGCSDHLGAAMLRVTADHDVRELKRAAILLAHQLQRGRESLSMLIKISAIVINEWLADKCIACGGRRYMISQTGVADACTVCNGEGVRRHSDTERRLAMKMSEHAYSKWERRFADAHEALSACNSKVLRDCSKQLERWAA